jgi:FlaA1/EpsC-like NDP-sugar epimerase
VILGFIPRGRHLLVYDILATTLAVLVSFAMRFDVNDIVATMGPYLPAALLPIAVYPPVYIAFGLYRREWRYASVREMFAIAAAVVVGTVTTIAIFLILAIADVGGTQGFPRSVFAIQALLGLALVGGGRFLLRASLEHRGSSGSEARLTLVYGAGEAGATVARLAARDPLAGMTVVGFLDDDRRKRGSRLLGRRVYGGLGDLPRAVSITGAERLLVAMPSAPGAAVRRALEAGTAAGLEVKTVPPLRELVTRHVDLSAIRPVRVDDLLRRQPIDIPVTALAEYLNGASVLVTGGGGSIGSELVRQILEIGPRQLTIVDHHELALWSVERDLHERAFALQGAQIDAILADVRGAGAIDAIMRKTRPDVVFHAAALKHVPMVERHPVEGVLTNVVGTRNVVRACEANGVERLVLISTDKAVEPESVMGATKRIAEFLVLGAARRTGRPYVAVRFGNVLGSSGSVIPTFERQLHAGLPLTITHPDATRYFMTISEAVSLILEAGSTSQSGVVFVLDMGQPVRIVDLAADLIRLAGIDPETVEFKFTGLRPGERLHERLFYDNEVAEPTYLPGVLRAREPSGSVTQAGMDHLVEQLEAAARDNDEQSVRELLHSVPRLALAREEAIREG